MNLGYNQITNNEYYTRFTNPHLNFSSNSIENNCYKSGTNKGQFKKKNVIPFNHWRKERVYKNRLGVNCPTNQIIFKDPLAISICNKKCNMKPNPDNPEYISSYSTLNENRNRNYNQNLYIIPPHNIKNKKNFYLENNTKQNKTVIKYSNPKFRKFGAVSSRNRIAALKNGNNNKYSHNNIYNKRCDGHLNYYNKKETIKKQVYCKGHGGGKNKINLLRCV